MREIQFCEGSSPHTRGAHTPSSTPLTDDGIIPAYAGSTWGAVAETVADADHPRIRGEHKPTPWTGRRWLGSSPHTRGALGILLAIAVQPGIIPAYAGSTWPVQPRPGSAAGSSPHTRGALRRSPRVGRAVLDHPRIRGEHSLQVPAPRPARGSSPHTRGARWTFPAMATRPRIIPAYAGSTSPASPGRS